MSRHATLRAGTVALALCSAAAVDAQRVAPGVVSGIVPRVASGAAPSRPSLIEAYRVRRDELLRRAAANREAEQRNVAAGRASYSVPVVRGRITLITSAAAVDSASRALAVADSLLGKTIYADATREPIALRFHVSYGSAAADSIDRQPWYLYRVDSHGREEALDWWPTAPSTTTLGRVLARQEMSRIDKLFPDSLRRWLNADLGARTVPDRWEKVYIALATSAAGVSRSCLLGSIPDCRQVLRLDEPRDALTEWFTPGARRAMVRPLADERNSERRRDIEGKLPGAISACLTGGDAACVKIVRDGSFFNDARYNDPLNGALGREALVIAAAEMPGAPGLRAIVPRSPLDVRGSLAAIGGTNVDLIVAEWHRRVVASQPETTELPARRLLSALAWTLVLCTGALRGSRWRSA
jgi:hypothetical protein